MADAPIIPIAGDADGGSIASGGAPSGLRKPASRLWQRGGGLSSVTRAALDGAERFLANTGFDRAPWLAVLFAAGILAWFALPGPWQWTATMGLLGLLALFALAAWRDRPDRDHLRRATIACSLVLAVGMAVIWARSEIVGVPAIERPTVERIQGYVLEREDQPAQDRIRLTLAVRDAETAQSRKIRVNVPLEALPLEAADIATSSSAMLAEGAVTRMRVRLMPPASPMLPGSYDFARAAWFKGLSATGSVIGSVEIVEPAPEATGLAAV